MKYFFIYELCAPIQAKSKFWKILGNSKEGKMDIQGNIEAESIYNLS